MFAELNGGGIDWGINADDLEFKKIPEIDTTKKYTVRGMFINRNKTEKELKEYGPSIVIITDEFKLSAPKFYETAVQTIIDDPEKVEAVKAGKCVIGDFYTYESHGKTCHAFKWIDA